MKYSIIIPAFNEGESLKELYQKIKHVMDTIAPLGYEYIFVNDGSTDNTIKVLKSLQKKDPAVRILSFRKNMGKAAALSIGFEKSSGEYIITMDADLQDEPAEIPKLIKKMAEGYDIVSGWKEDRKDPFDKTIPSKVFNIMVSTLSGVRFHDFNCGFKLYKQVVIKEVDVYGQLHRFIPVLANERGFKIAEVKVKHNKRKYGKSKYTWKRIFAGIMDLLTVMFLARFGRRPLHLFGAIGGVLVILGLVSLVYLSILHFTGHSIARRPLLIFAATFFISGLQIIFTGLIAEMLTKYTHNNKEYPIMTEAELAVI